MKLSELIKEFRSTNGLSQRKFAAMCGLSSSTMSLVENDNINPLTGKKMALRYETYFSIANALHMTIDELFSTVDDVPVSLNNSAASRPVDPPLTDLQRRIISATDDVTLELYQKISDMSPDELLELRGYIAGRFGK